MVVAKQDRNIQMFMFPGLKGLLQIKPNLDLRWEIPRNGSFYHLANLWMPGWICLAVFLLPGLVWSQVVSKIVADDSLGTVVTQNGNVFDIGGGTTIDNTVLFQSLEFFTVGTGDIASFNGASNITNILTRVTGNEVSTIDGTIRSTIPGANLALFNRQGILFMENARLDIGGSVGKPGSFYASTADEVTFSDGGKFSTFLNPDETDVLTSAPFTEFGFFDTPAPILVQNSMLRVTVDTSAPGGPTGKTLALIGGDISVTGNGAPPSGPVGGSLFNEILNSQLSAPSGTIKLASLSTSGTVNVSNLDIFGVGESGDGQF